MSEWSDWSDESLLEYERDLYDREVSGENTWDLRNMVLWEINRRGLLVDGQ